MFYLPRPIHESLRLDSKLACGSNNERKALTRAAPAYPKYILQSALHIVGRAAQGLTYPHGIQKLLRVARSHLLGTPYRKACLRPLKSDPKPLSIRFGSCSYNRFRSQHYLSRASMRASRDFPGFWLQTPLLINPKLEEGNKSLEKC